MIHLVGTVAGDGAGRGYQPADGGRHRIEEASNSVWRRRIGANSPCTEQNGPSFRRGISVEFSILHRAHRMVSPAYGTTSDAGLLLNPPPDVAFRDQPSRSTSKE